MMSQPSNPNQIKSFGDAVDAGLSPEELKKRYALNDSEYDRVMSSLQQIRNSKGKRI